MVDVGSKEVTHREALARGRVRLSRAAYDAIIKGEARKGDVLGVAQVAGIQAAKRTGELIPLAHPLPLDSVELDLRPEPQAPAIEIEARVRATARTGVEMEALTAVAGAALALYDMCKSLDRAMVIEAIRLVRKTGGKSGTYVREGEP